MTNRTSEPTQSALDAFMAGKVEFDELLEKLSEMSSNHFSVDPAQVDWGHVGTLREQIKQLRRAVGGED